MYANMALCNQQNPNISLINIKTKLIIKNSMHNMPIKELLAVL